jgi:segregation and condensation protein B
MTDGPSLRTDTALEALLFVAGEPVPRDQLAEWLEIPVDQVDGVAATLATALAGRGLSLLRHDDRYQLVTTTAASLVVRRMLGQSGATKLSNAVSEVLTIIAYRQPITRAQIEAIRGVDCSNLVRQLQVRELITDVGRLDTVGRPVLYATTDHFLRQFGLASLAELPPLAIPEVAVISDEESAVQSMFPVVPLGETHID